MQNNKGFTLIEIIITITTITVLFLLCFSLIMFINENNHRNKNQLFLHDNLNNLKNEFYNKKGITVSFYNYSELFHGDLTSYEFENIFRTDLKYLIENGMSKFYEKNINIESLIPCSPLYETLFVTTKDEFQFENYGINTCVSDINSFDENHNILVITNKADLSINVYLVNNYNLFRINGYLDKNLINDDIILKDRNKINVQKITNDIYVTEFKGKSTNICGIKECTFFDFTGIESTGVGYIVIKLLKLDIFDDEPNFNTSYMLEDIININTK